MTFSNMTQVKDAVPLSALLPQVIRLSDCIRVTEVDMDGCPRDTGPFLVETTEKIFMFAADREQLDDWTQKLCEIAFPVSARAPSRNQFQPVQLQFC